MTTNQELAEIFRGIADLLDLQGERFKPEAYRRAARSIESLPEDVRAIAARGELHEVPGVGDAIAEKTEEFLSTGRIAYFDRLTTSVPAGVLEMMRLGGVGPKTARRFLVEFGIEGPAELSEAIATGRLNGVKGFGPRKLELLQKAVARGTPTAKRTALFDAWSVARRLVDELRHRAPLEKVEVAGSLRRRRESVGDLDILVTSTTPEAVFDAFTHLPGVTEVTLRGPTKETVVVDGKLQVDLRVVEPAAFGAALQYFTGSKDHNVRLRTLARDHGLKVNEYGVFRGEERVAGATEEEVYRALGLAWIPPEVRENQAEFDLALAGRSPNLVAGEDLLGDFHVHLSPGPTIEEVDRRVREAGERGWTLLGLVWRETDPRPRPALVEHLRSLRSAGDRRPAVRLGVETAVGATPTALDADYRVWDLTGLPSPPDGTPAATGVRFAAHLTLATPTQEASASAAQTWVDWAKRRRLALEVGPRGAADGLDSTGVHFAETAGVSLHLTAGVRSASDSFDPVELAVGLARRGWLSPAHAINREDPAGPTRGRAK